MAGHYLTTDSAETVECELWADIDPNGLEQAIEADLSATGKSSWERLDEQSREYAQSYFPDELVDELKAHIPS